MVFPSTWNSRIVPGGSSATFAARTKAIRFLLGVPPADAAVCSRIGLARRRRLRHHHAALEVLGHLRPQPHFRRPLRQRHLVDLILQFQQRVKKALRPRRAANYVHIDWHNLVHTLQDRIRIERAADARTRSHGNAPLWIGHLIPNALQHRSHLQRYCPGDNHEVRLTRRRAKHFCAEPRNVKARSRGGDHFDGATRQSECQRPDGAFSRPVEHIVHRRNQKILLKSLIKNAHALILSYPACCTRPGAYRPCYHASKDLTERASSTPAVCRQPAWYRRRAMPLRI